MATTLVIEPGIIGSARLQRVAFLTGLDEDAAAGKLMRLLAFSQELEVTEAGLDEIGFWLRANSLDHAKKWADAFADSMAKFLKALPGDRYEIIGNGKHIEKIKAVSDAQRERALKRWQNVGKRTTADAGSVPPEYHGDTGGMPNASENDAGGIPGVCPSQALPSQALPSQAIIPPNPQNSETGEPGKPKSVQPESVRACINSWRETLQACGIAEPLSEFEVNQILEAIQCRRFGSAEDIALALYGARHEPGFESFNPKEHVSLGRIFQVDDKAKPTRFDKYLQWGKRGKQADATKKAKEKAEQEAQEKAEQEEREFRERLNRFKMKVPDRAARLRAVESLCADLPYVRDFDFESEPAIRYAMTKWHQQGEWGLSSAGLTVLERASR